MQPPYNSLMKDLPVATIEDVERALREHHYIADRSLATTLFLSLTLDKPLLLEGEAGVGKTEVGKVLADILKTRLIRLQCYEGIDVNNAVYEWAYAKQMLHIRLLESALASSRAGGPTQGELEREIYSHQFLVKRPLLQAIESDGGTAPVLLIDEIDRADDEFEAFLLELLSDFQISIPEIGTIKAVKPPAVIITSNRTREIHDALKRRCLYFWIDYPSVDREYEIIIARVPEVPKKLAKQVSAFIGGVRRLDLYKLPGIAETLDWTRSLIALGQSELDEAAVQATLGSIVKYQEDLERLRGAGSRELLARAVNA
jgi:MoxR-like ATPase